MLEKNRVPFFREILGFIDGSIHWHSNNHAIHN